MKKRFLALFLVFVLSISLLAGCQLHPRSGAVEERHTRDRADPFHQHGTNRAGSAAEDVVYKDELPCRLQSGAGYA